METNLLDRMLSAYLTDQTPVVVTLLNKIRVSGRIKAFDSYVLIIEGQKREIVYRHAVSSLTQCAPEEQKRHPVFAKPPQTKTSRPSRAPLRKPRPAQQPALSAAAADQSINNSMKDGLLRWMQEQKAAK